MSDTTTIGREPEEEILTYEVSDEALEAAAVSKEVGNYTLACTYFYFCPI
jgi:hypothetical protein